MIRKIIFLFLVTTSLLNAQSDMTKGFGLLEQGNFQAAEDFFAEYLTNDPTNKTAKLCYGRAVGLSGEPKKATNLFADLLKEYPGDFEILINYNESFLWAKEYEQAKPLYADLVEKFPDKFGAVLGYANTLSNLKEYKLALSWVEKAIALQPENESAKISRKFMRLGYANSFVNDQQYKKGEQTLKKIFEDFPNDKDVLINLANLYLIIKQADKAKSMYARYATNQKDSITALNGIALAQHIDENDKEALLTSKSATNEVDKIDDVALTESTYDRYVQALIWNRKFITAKKKIDSLEVHYKNRNWIHALRATLGLYTGDAKSSVKSYDRILVNDSASFDGNLGKANALFASDRIVPAYKMANQTLKFYKNQKDAKGFIEKLNLMHTPTTEEHAAYTFDNGNNTAFYTNTTVDVPFSTKFRTTFSYFFRSTENTVTDNKATSHVALMGLQYKLFPKTVLKTVLGFNNSRFLDEAYTQPVLDIKLDLQPFKLQNLTLGYQREVQSFNAELIEREIVQNHYGLNFNLGTNVNFGWYTQLMHTQQSDENVRNLLFTSLYYNILRKPALKMGLNYQYITFKDQVPTIYFSPEKYQAVELFADLRGKISEKTSYAVSAATGIQQVEDDPNTNIFRAEASVLHQFSKRFSLSIYGKYSNIASATAAGYEFTEVGLKAKWLFLKKPLFYKKLKLD
ncbi:tetratricopeptide repeat protein [Maribacter litoralis]|uniref:Tetratricopeptide repeat-containing protein n=1 Tax=Maribacter litoralis TaxID=2059726 RepID=A0A653V850_9FLAO|nr:tetratricopeptide repeat protein [Maribacter litoralis]VXB95936.1 Tetratricopeptide repeat-containing protein [Maribacter litoralis]